MKKIAFIITGLSRGGAERMLIKILKAISRKEFTPAVFCLTKNLALKPEIEALGIQVYSYNFNSILGMIPSLFSFIRDCRNFVPDILQGWMYHGNILAWVARRFCRAKLIFGIRASLYDFKFERSLTRGIIRLGAFLSKSSDKIIYVSSVARTQHEDIGYAEQGITLANGFELDKFNPDQQLRQEYRDRFQISDEIIIIGYFARFHILKGHYDLIQAFAQIHRKYSKTRLILAGMGIDESNSKINQVLRDKKLDQAVLLLGELSNPENVLPALDIFVSPSHQEGFPNVVGEAMACGVPCVVTDVGDSALAVGETGYVVPPMEPRALAAAICQMIEDPLRQAKGGQARERIETEFSLSAIVKKYEDVYQNILTESL